jgi:transcription termination/antitermination protein NusA
VVVPEDQLALAIGKEGLNARLAARLTGWKVDIQSDVEFAQAEAEAAYGGGADEEEFSGRCAAILSNGKRCPNASLPGSRFCGVPAHQELAQREAAGEPVNVIGVVPAETDGDAAEPEGSLEADEPVGVVAEEATDGGEPPAEEPQAAEEEAEQSS